MSQKVSKAAMECAEKILDVLLPEPFRIETAAIPGTIEDIAAQIQAAMNDLLTKADVIICEVRDRNPNKLALIAALEPWKVPE